MPGVFCSDLTLSLGTWNCNSLFGSSSALSANFSLQIQKRRRLARLLPFYDILAIQETHGSRSDLRELRTLAPSHFFCGSFTGPQGGVVLAVKRSICQSEPSMHVVEPGFGIIASFSTHSGPVSIFNVHVHPHWTPDARLSFFKDASKHIIQHPGCISFVLGDFITQ